MWTWTEREREQGVWGSAEPPSGKPRDRSCVAGHDLHVLGGGLEERRC